MMVKSDKAPEVGRHGWSGSCAPGGSGRYVYDTFSVGVFEWEKASTRAGVKPGNVKVRVSGDSLTPDIVYAKAREVAAALDAGTYSGPKNLRV